jgi:AraC family transcriptional regulator
MQPGFPRACFARMKMLPIGLAGIKFSTVLEASSSVRIRVRQEGYCVPVVAGVPALSSAESPWQGALLERHVHGPYSLDTHQHLSYFLCVHLSSPAPVLWRSGGKAGQSILRPGGSVVLTRGTEDTFSFPQPMERILLNLDLALFQRALPDRASAPELMNQWGANDRQIEYIVRALEADIQSGLPAGKLYGESLLTALAVHLQRRYGVAPPKDEKTRNGLPKTRLNRVLEYIEANLHQDVALTALAETAGMSPHYFSEMFRQSTDFSPHQYVLRRRIERARKLLHDARVSVFEAGVRSGFSEPSHFTKMFRRIVGVTPTRYRAAL